MPDPIPLDPARLAAIRRDAETARHFHVACAARQDDATTRCPAHILALLADRAALSSALADAGRRAREAVAAEIRGYAADYARDAIDTKAGPRAVVERWEVYAAVAEGLRTLADRVALSAPPWPPMTLERAVGVLNERGHRGDDGWRIRADPYLRDQIEVISTLGIVLMPFECIAVAEAYERMPAPG